MASPADAAAMKAAILAHEAKIQEYETKMQYLVNQIQELWKAAAEHDKQIKDTPKGGQYRRRPCDPKFFHPSKFNDNTNGTPFRKWAQEVKNYMRHYSQKMVMAMEATEYQRTTLTSLETDDYNLDVDEHEDLMTILRMFTEGSAQDKVNLMSKEHALEVWRNLTNDNDPNNDHAQVNLSRFLRAPGVAKNMTEMNGLMTR